MSPDEARADISTELATADEALRRADANLNILSVGPHAHRAYGIPEGTDTRFTDNYDLTVVLDEAIRATRAARALDGKGHGPQARSGGVAPGDGAPSRAFHAIGIDLASANASLRRIGDLTTAITPRDPASGDPLDERGDFMHFLTEAARHTHAALAINDRIQRFAQTA